LQVCKGCCDAFGGDRLFVLKLKEERIRALGPQI
jgi:hypothetical protein